MKELIDLLVDNEDWLVRRILHYAKRHGYTEYTSTLEEAWRLSVSGLSASLVAGFRAYGAIPHFGADDSFSSDPLTAFGILEARRHRERGVTLAMFLGLLKYYRQCYLDLLHTKPPRPGAEGLGPLLQRAFDRIELALCQEWAKTGPDELIDQLQASARTMTNQKNAYLTVFESLSDPVILLDAHNEIINLNHAAAQLMDPHTNPGAAYYHSAGHGMPAADVGEGAMTAHWSAAGAHVLDVFPWLTEVIPKTPQDSPSHGWSECEALIADQPRHFEARCSTMLDVGATSIAAIVTLRDVTQRKQAEQALMRREAAISAIFRTAPTGIGLISSRRLTEVNDRMCEMLGYEAVELLGREARLLYPNEEEYRRVTGIARGTGSARSCGTVEARWVRKDGQEISVLLSSAPMDPSAPSAGVTFTALDITRRKSAEEKLRQYADTQATLLREVNHRVKNNLCAIMGMLHMEQDRAETYGAGPYPTLLGELVSRVRGLATVHSLLSASEWRPLGLARLCREVIKAALKGLPPYKSVTLDVSTPDVQVQSHQAQHLTLVLNELTTNTIKHALIERDKARIEVEARREYGMLWLQYRDDGPGYPQAVLDSRLPRAAIGFELVQGIVSKSLGGSVEFENRDGAVARIRFAPV